MNIIYIMTDQWRWDTIFQGDHVCQTPNLDRFAEEATVFGNAYTCYPLCSPARGALFTGKWPYQNSLTDNVNAGSFYPNGKLHPRCRTYLERLRDDADYEIAYCGKWHLGHGTLTDRGIDNVAIYAKPMIKTENNTNANSTRRVRNRRSLSSIGFVAVCFPVPISQKPPYLFTIGT